MNVWWWICLVLALLFLVSVPVFGWIRDKRDKKGRAWFRYFCVGGVLLSAACLFFPIQLENLDKSNAYSFQAIVSSFIYSMQLFTLNVSFNEMPDVLSQAGFVAVTHSILLTLEFVLAPILTFTIVLSFFRNVYSWLKFWWWRKRDTYVFSELNERSLVLAKSIYETAKEKDRRICLVFTDVNGDKEKEVPESKINKARRIRALCFRRDILSLNLARRAKNRELTLYLIAENETENIVQSMDLIDQFRKRDRCRLYVFTSRAEGEYLLNKKADTENGRSKSFQVRRINATASLISRNLFYDGYNLLYKTAAAGPSGGKKRISAVLVGLGGHGMEMFRSLVWYGQMYGYELEINAFDKDPTARKQVIASCPGLFSLKDRARDIEDPPEWAYDCEYNIHIHPDMDTDSAEFVHTLKRIKNPTYVLVALGDDEKNIRTAVDLRALFERGGSNPEIQAIVYNSRECRILDGIHNFNSEPYGIDFFGDVESSYTEKVLINEELEKEALQIHLEYNKDEEALFDYEYNYRSSCASAIHSRAVAQQLLDTHLNPDLVDDISFWLKLGLRVFKPPKTDKKTGETKADLFREKAFQEFMSWSEHMSAFVDWLAALPDFPLGEWETMPVDKEQTDRMNEVRDRMIALHHEFLEVQKKIGGHPEMFTGEKTYTLGRILGCALKLPAENGQEDAEKGEKAPYTPDEAARHLLLTVKLMKLEHERWLAYMRAEGYAYAEQRNDLGRMHNDMKSYIDLDRFEKGKDLHMKLLIKQQQELRKAREAAARKAAEEKKKAEEVKQKEAGEH